MNEITMGIIAFAFVIGAMYQLFKRSTLNTLRKTLARGDFATYQKILNSDTTAKVMNNFTREKLRLRGYVLSKEEEEIKRLVDKLLSMRLSAQNEEEFIVTYYHYFLNKEDETYIQIFLDRIAKMNNPALLKESNQAYDVLIKKQTTYIEEMDKQIEKARGFSLGLIVYLMGMQYLYLDDKKNAQMYFFNALMSLKNTIYEAKAKKYVDELGKQLKEQEEG